jgi:DNA invertase Pin-like site-specific DNA recombinase
MPSPAISFVSVMDPRSRGAGIERPEVQRFAIGEFAEGAGYDIVERFVEYLEPGQADDPEARPVLRQAIEMARRDRVPIIIASLGRLSRDTSVLADLMIEDVMLIVSGLGVVNEPFALMPLAHLPEAARGEGRDDTSKAWSKAEADSGLAGRYAREVLAPANRRAADDRARALLPVIRPKIVAGKSLRQIAEELNREGVPTARGGRWHLATVQRLLARLRE